MPPRSQLWLLAALALAGVVSAFSGRMDQYFLEVALGAGINVILAVSLNLINGFTGQFSLGHAGFMAVGAYFASIVSLGIQLPFFSLPEYEFTWGWFAKGKVLLWILGGVANAVLWLFNHLSSTLHALPMPLQFFAALLLGGFLAALTGFAVGAPSLRLKGDYLAIVTLGFGEIIKVILQNVDAVGGARGLISIPSYTNLFWTFGGAAVTVYVVWALVNSTYGRGFLAVADDEVAAEAMGLNTTRYKITAFVVGSFFAGVAGGLYAHLKGYISPGGFDFNKSIEIVVIVILGGMGRHVGVILAAVLLTVVMEPLRKFGDYRLILYSLLLIVLMLTRPQGLFTWPLGKKKTA